MFVVQRWNDLPDMQRRLAGSPSAKSAEPDMSKRVIVVGVGFGPPSRRALRRAHALQSSLGCQLRIVHAVPHNATADQLTPSLGVLQLTDASDWEERMQITVQTWAAVLAGVMIPTSQICAVRGEPLNILLREAAQPDVIMVVVGQREEPGAEPSATLPRLLLRLCPRPMLVVGTRGLKPVIVAATDCSDERLPVLREATSLVPAFGQKIVAVHNLDAEASQLAAHTGRPMTPQIASMLCTQVQEWLEEAKDDREVLITAHAESAEGVLAAAKTQQANLLVVGVKRELVASNRTAEVLLDEARISVLFVPVDIRKGQLNDVPVKRPEGQEAVPVAEQKARTA